MHYAPEHPLSDFTWPTTSSQLAVLLNAFNFVIMGVAVAQVVEQVTY